MVTYYVVKKTEDDGSDDENCGICACSISDGMLEIKSSVYGLPDDRELLNALIQKLNDNGIDPVHLPDVIADELYILKH